MHIALKKFSLWIILGIISTILFLTFIPIVNLTRENSIIHVQTNGGAIEDFYIFFPEDQLFENEVKLSNIDIDKKISISNNSEESRQKLQIFKIRNEDNKIIGVASRLSENLKIKNPFMEWVLHIPARGSMYFKIDPNSQNKNFTQGTLLFGTRDFNNFSGSIIETIKDKNHSKNDKNLSINLRTILVNSNGESL